MKTFADKRRCPSGAVRQLQFLAPPPCIQMSVNRQEIRQVLRGPNIQPKLEVGPEDDVYEKEADRMADLITRMPDPLASPEAA